MRFSTGAEGRQMTTFKLSLGALWGSCDVAADLRQLSPPLDPIGWWNGPLKINMGEI
jgi:hypothetical protein